MQTRTTSEAQGMGRTQKSMMVPDDLYKLIANRESKTGATFTRQTVAALFQYFFSDPRGPDPRWMEAVIAVEQGKMTVGDVASWATSKNGELAAEAIRLIFNEFGTDSDGFLAKSAGEPELLRYRQIAQTASNNGAEWAQVARLADDRIDALLTFWERLDSGIRDSQILNASDVAAFRKRDPKSESAEDSADE